MQVPCVYLLGPASTVTYGTVRNVLVILFAFHAEFYEGYTGPLSTLLYIRNDLETEYDFLEVYYPCTGTKNYWYVDKTQYIYCFHGILP